MSAYGWYDCSAAVNVEAERVDEFLKDDPWLSPDDEGTDDEG